MPQIPNQNPEQIARDAIDAQLIAAGWSVQAKDAINFHAGEGQAVREYTTDSGPADYVLFVDGHRLGENVHRHHVDLPPAETRPRPPRALPRGHPQSRRAGRAGIPPAFTPTDDNRKFTELYTVARLASSHVPTDAQVCISTIQQRYSILQSRELDASAEDENPAERSDRRREPLPVAYSEKLPPEFFDLIVIDECHRSIYNLYRTNIHHTLKRKPLRFEDLADFIACYNPENRHKRKETWHAGKNPEGRWRKITHAELAARDKTSLDLFWLKDDSLADLENLPEPNDLAEDIIENIEAGLESFRAVAAALPKSAR